MPGNLTGGDLGGFVRDAAMSYWQQTCTAEMGLDAMSMVDGALKVYGIEHLRIADGSIMPRRHHPKHAGPLRHHRRTRGRNPQGPAHPLTSPRKGISMASKQ